MAIVIGGREIELKGARSCSWLDGTVPRVTDRTERTRRVRAIVLHTHEGTATGAIKSDRLADDRTARALARYQSSTTRTVSWDYTVGRDGVVLAQSDPAVEYTWHATAWNPISIGIELVQDEDGALYDAQLDALVSLCDTLTREFRIQRQIPWRDGSPMLGVIYRADEQGTLRGSDMVGVFAHANNTRNRGRGDPGPAPFYALHEAGYELFDFAVGEDSKAWRDRQVRARMKPDGIPLDATCSALVEAGHPHGLWVERPYDR
jgi:hypothetical protein